jgi:hypothetical protein
MKTKSKNTQDSQSEKLVPGHTLIVDIVSIPKEHGMDMDQWAHLIKEQGVIFYDSERGNAPELMPENQDIKMYDVQEEESMKELQAELDNLTGPLHPIIQPTRTPDEEESIINNLRSTPSENTITFTNMGETTGNLTIDSNMAMGVDSYDSVGTSNFIGGHSAGSIGVEGEIITGGQAATLMGAWEEVTPVAVDGPGITGTPIVYGTGGEGVLTMEENTVSSVFSSEPEVERPYGVLTEESLTESINEVMSNRQVDPRTGVAVVGSPLTDAEINQLEIEDPRGPDTLMPSQEQQDNAYIDSVMSRPEPTTISMARDRGERITVSANGTRSRRSGPSVRRPRQLEQGFTLTDDTV